MKSFLGLNVVAVLAAGLAGCAVDPGAPGGSAPAEVGTAGQFLFGLSEREVVSLHPMVESKYGMDKWLEINRAPFDCGQLGGICSQVGPDAAYSITERSYRMALSGMSIEEIDAYLSTSLSEAALAWEAKGGGRDHDDARHSNTFFGYGGSNQERVKLEVTAGTPLVGSNYREAVCTYQIKVLGVWGGLNSAQMTACVGASAPPGSCASNNAHTVTKKLLGGSPPFTAHGSCSATKLPWSASVSGSASH